jgi:peptide/nickel transport system substrate-binding protein
MVRFRFIPDSQQQSAELAAGGCDVLLGDGLSAGDGALFPESVNVLESSGSAYEQVTFNTQPEPFTNIPFFADARLRQAIAQGMDRSTLAQQSVQGLTPVMDSWLPADHWAYAGTGELPAYGFDPATASALLDAAGWQDQDGDGEREYHGSGGTYTCQRGEWQIEEGTPLAPTLITTTDPLRSLIAEKMRDDLAAIGVGLQVQPIPAETLFSLDGPLAHRTFDLALFSASARPDPDGISRFVGADVFLHPLDLVPVHRWELENRWLTSEQLVERLALNNSPSAVNSFQGQNYGAYCNEAADIATVSASESISIPERQGLYMQQQTQIALDVPLLPLFARPRIAVSASYVCGITIRPYGPLTWNLDHWTFDASGACSP